MYTKLMPADSGSKLPNLIFPVLSGVTIASLIGISILFAEMRKDLNSLRSDYNEVKKSQSVVQESLPELFYADHLSVMQKDKMAFMVSELQKQIAEPNIDQNIQQINSIFIALDSFKSKLSRNSGVKLDISSSEQKLNSWGSLMLSKEYQKLSDELLAEIKTLDESYNKYVASLPAPAVSGGYSYTTVKTDQGTSHGVYLIKLPLSEVEVRTVAAISSSCSDSCATKSLEAYIKENNGFAGMNGSYFCPPDYAECSGKVNSFDYAFYDSGDNKWINKDALEWFKTGLLTFNGSSANFYRESTGYDGGGVDAAISNYPSLLNDGRVVVKNSDLTSFQKVRGLRGVIAVGDGNIFLAQISSATVEEAAYVMKSLGADDALNLDGGGSSAMYINGKYVLGPGRSLANAIVLVKK
jgi:hypothetical protein